MKKNLEADLRLATEMLTWGIMKDDLKLLVEARGILKNILGIRRVTPPDVSASVVSRFKKEHPNWEERK